MINIMDVLTPMSVALNTYFCNGTDGRSKKDPVYQYVVEKRDFPAMYTRYSSCGDRAHALLFRLGVRESWINRNEHKGWRVGQNISALAFGPKFAKKPGEDWVPHPGDELLIWNSQSGGDAHSQAIFVAGQAVLDFRNGTATFANYGASGMSAAEFPGGRLSESKLVYDSKTKNWMSGKRIVQRVLRLSDIATVITARPNPTYIDGTMLPDMSRAIDEYDLWKTEQ